jgi:acyl-homoserine-lactone acylase
VPWAGLCNIEGGFNVLDMGTGNNGSMLSRHVYLAQNSDSILSAEGQRLSY